jgi:hypothetical protein
MSIDRFGISGKFAHATATAIITHKQVYLTDTLNSAFADIVLGKER